jgi:hypothetical protein
MLKWYLFLLFFAFGVREGMGQVVINEVMANVRGSESGAGSPGDRNEFVELYNFSTDTIDVDGWFLDDGDARDILQAWTDTTINDPDVILNTTRIPPNFYAVILDPEYPDSGDGNYLQPYDFPPSSIILTIGNTTLGNGLSTTDPISLFDRDTLLTDTYGTPSDTTDSIPNNPGDGLSMERIDPSLPDQETNWRPSTDPTGSTPGGVNSSSTIDIDEVVINEVMANVKGSESGVGAPGDRNEFVELLNISPDTVDVDRWSLDDGDVIDVLQEWTDPFIQDPDVVINTTKIPPGFYAVILDPEYTEIGDTMEVQPYDFHPNTIILTVGNTTLGDGLNPKDPLSLLNRINLLIDTYGTPSDTTDTIPFDPGDGISMERIDPALPDHDSNWRPCNDSTGYTPGRENSEEREEVKPDTFQVVRINISPDPFSPDGDGENDQTTFSFELPFQSAKVRLRIYDRTGRVRKTVVDQETMGNQGSIVWQGKDEGGKILPIGVYILFLEATDDATGRLVTSKKALTLVKRLK